MPRFYMNLRYRDRLFRDPEGDELPDASAARTYARETARDLLGNGRSEAIRDWLDCDFEITDEGGRVVMVVPFAEGVAENDA